VKQARNHSHIIGNGFHVTLRIISPIILFKVLRKKQHKEMVSASIQHAKYAVSVWRHLAVIICLVVAAVNATRMFVKYVELHCIRIVKWVADLCKIHSVSIRYPGLVRNTCFQAKYHIRCYVMVTI